MNEFRITKYNPQYRLNGIFLRNEWTSISDIGKEFDDGILTTEIYTAVENAYIQFCLEISMLTNTQEFNVTNIELYDNSICVPSSASSKDDSLRKVIKWCLREQCWAKLESEHCFIHFGYDYNMYIGTEIPLQSVSIIAHRFGLFFEPCSSPYYRNN